MAGVTPNQYRLHNQSVKITYVTSGIQGKPHLHFDDGQQVQEFDGSEVRVTDTEIGSLVSVTIRITVDSGSTSYSVMIPIVNFGSTTDHEKFHTFGVRTVHKTSLVLPSTGQRETYHLDKLEGVAEAIQTLGAQAGN